VEMLSEFLWRKKHRNKIFVEELQLKKKGKKKKKRKRKTQNLLSSNSSVAELTVVIIRAYNMLTHFPKHISAITEVILTQLNLNAIHQCTSTCKMNRSFFLCHR
jgi:uncharacterized membrane protein